jgi:hypothetical protein
MNRRYRGFLPEHETRAVGLVVVLRLAVRPTLPHGIGPVDVWRSGGLWQWRGQENGRRQRPLKRLGCYLAFNALPLKPLQRRPPA